MCVFSAPPKICWCWWSTYHVSHWFYFRINRFDSKKKCDLFMRSAKREFPLSPLFFLKRKGLLNYFWTIEKNQQIEKSWFQKTESAVKVVHRFSTNYVSLMQLNCIVNGNVLKCILFSIWDPIFRYWPPVKVCYAIFFLPFGKLCLKK